MAADPEAFVRGILAGSNQAAKVKLLELSSELRRYRLREREEGLEERERDVSRRQDRLAALEGWREDAEADVERLAAQRAELEASLAELRAANARRAAPPPLHSSE